MAFMLQFAYHWLLSCLQTRVGHADNSDHLGAVSSAVDDAIALADIVGSHWGAGSNVERGTAVSHLRCLE